MGSVSIDSSRSRFTSKRAWRSRPTGPVTVSSSIGRHLTHTAQRTDAHATEEPMLAEPHNQEPGLTQIEIDQQVYDLYDEYCHGRIDRREFLRRASVLTVGGVSALAMAEALVPRYARAQTISSTDPRIHAEY